MVRAEQENPFKPTAGKMPPELIGREDALSEFDEGLANGPGAPGRLMRVTGARGMGKTVLLREFRRIAHDTGWTVLGETGQEGLCERIVQRLCGGVVVERASAALHVFGASGSVELARRELDLQDAVARAAGAGGSGNKLLITLDEVQDAPLEEVGALGHAVQRAISEDLDIAFVFAGLPSMTTSVVEGKTLTFLRRALPVEVGAIDIGDVAWSYAETFNSTGVRTDDAAAEEMALASQGYPYMVQLVGYYCWRAAQGNAGQVDAAAIAQGVQQARERFDAVVLEPALQHVSAGQMRYLLAMSEDGGQASGTAEVAKRLGKSQTAASSIRAALVKGNLIEARRWGKVAFAVPYLCEYLVAHADEIARELG